MTTVSRFLDQDLADGSAVRVTRVGMLRVWDDEPLVLCADVIMADGSVLRYPCQDYAGRYGLIALEVHDSNTSGVIGRYATTTDKD